MARAVLVACHVQHRADRELPAALLGEERLIEAMRRVPEPEDDVQELLVLQAGRRDRGDMQQREQHCRIGEAVRQLVL